MSLCPKYHRRAWQTVVSAATTENKVERTLSVAGSIGTEGTGAAPSYQRSAQWGVGEGGGEGSTEALPWALLAVLTVGSP